MENAKKFRLILFLVFVLFAFVLFYLYQTSRKTEGGVNIVAPTFVPTRATTGTFSLNQVGDAQLTANKQFELDVVATSEGRSIVGYDLVLTYDPQAIEVVKAASLLEDFSIYPLKRADHYSLTATKKLASQTPTLLDSTPVLRLTLLARKAGSLQLTLVRQLGVEKTQMVDDKTQVLSPRVGKISLTIQ